MTNKFMRDAPMFVLITGNSFLGFLIVCGLFSKDWFLVLMPTIGLVTIICYIIRATKIFGVSLPDAIKSHKKRWSQ